MALDRREDVLLLELVEPIEEGARERAALRDDGLGFVASLATFFNISSAASACS